MKTYILFVLLLLAGCDKDPQPPASTAAVQTSLTVLAITRTGATCSGNVTGDYGSPVIEKGICWSVSSNPSINNSKQIAGTGTGDFSATLNGLTPAKIYYFRAYAVNQLGVSYGEVVSFKTLN